MTPEEAARRIIKRPCRPGGPSCGTVGRGSAVSLETRCGSCPDRLRHSIAAAIEAALAEQRADIRCETCRFWWPNVQSTDPIAKREPCTHPDVRRMLGTVPMTEAGFACLTGWEAKEGNYGDPPAHG